MTTKSELFALSVSHTEDFFRTKKQNILDNVEASINQAAMYRLTSVVNDISILNLDKIQSWYKLAIVDFIQRDKEINGLSAEESEEKHKGKLDYDFYDDLLCALTKIYASHPDPNENLNIEIRGDNFTQSVYLYISWK